ncbi:glutathione-dependent formaldehyde-activating enzyme domain-containing protein [Trichoderma breve]|uniref:Glutathione-dependent formaldehyde-activating enzyme domain-containing protein n=1 Tax=Trichoderma breve TaxID=2034170 RepID=A0A9W9E9V6_9HYPO|nr:glutathione-dependent formaldehyde-activating enzyme domain-containing protein [Trichoderma breve]KAJ4860691.1 glutathione-dependent formaldehyde-activating enzyme domain-containing protein [Trichoderma breve]
MPTGSCYCGNIKIEYTGEPERTAICHCSNCRHYTGSMFSNNYVIPSTQFKVFGEPKEISKIADSGKKIVNCFCGDCGTTMYRWGDGFGGKDGMRIIQPGILDDKSALDNLRPALEMFIEDRVKWISAVEGLAQHEGMPPP